MRTPTPWTALAAAVTLAAAAVPSAHAAQGYPPGFQVDLSDDQHIECWVQQSRLRCLNYSRQTAQKCDFGGTVSTVVLRRTGGLKRTYTCVDEGCHGWKVLRSGQTFRSGPFTCRLRDERSRPRCSDKSRTVTIAAA